MSHFMSPKHRVSRRFLASGVALAGLLMVSTASVGKDLGTYGELYEVREQDLFQRMAFEASGADFKAETEKRQTQAKEWFEGAPEHVSLNSARETKSFFIRHELVVTSDFKVPVLIDKETGVMVQTPVKNISEYRVEYRHLARKGDRHNVVDNPTYSLQEKFLVFNPDIESEREFAMASADADQSLMLVTTHGDILELSKESGKPVHLLFPSLEDIFQIENTPSLLRLSRYKDEKILAVTEFGKADRDPKKAIETLERYWSGPLAPDEAELKTVSRQIDPRQVMRQFGGPQ